MPLTNAFIQRELLHQQSDNFSWGLGLSALISSKGINPISRSNGALYMNSKHKLLTLPYDYLQKSVVHHVLEAIMEVSHICTTCGVENNDCIQKLVHRLDTSHECHSINSSAYENLIQLYCVIDFLVQRFHKINRAIDQQAVLFQPFQNVHPPQYEVNNDPRYPLEKLGDHLDSTLSYTTHQNKTLLEIGDNKNLMELKEEAFGNLHDKLKLTENMLNRLQLELHKKVEAIQLLTEKRREEIKTYNEELLSIKVEMQQQSEFVVELLQCLGCGISIDSEAFTQDSQRRIVMERVYHQLEQLRDANCKPAQTLNIGSFSRKSDNLGIEGSERTSILHVENSDTFGQCCNESERWDNMKDIEIPTLHHEFRGNTEEFGVSVSVTNHQTGKFNERSLASQRTSFEAIHNFDQLESGSTIDPQSELVQELCDIIDFKLTQVERDRQKGCGWPLTKEMVQHTAKLIDSLHFAYPWDHKLSGSEENRSEVFHGVGFDGDTDADVSVISECSPRVEHHTSTLSTTHQSQTPARTPTRLLFLTSPQTPPPTKLRTSINKSPLSNGRTFVPASPECKKCFSTNRSTHRLQVKTPPPPVKFPGIHSLSNVPIYRASLSTRDPISQLAVGHQKF
jgi:hypothetical protein